MKFVVEVAVTTKGKAERGQVKEAVNEFLAGFVGTRATSKDDIEVTKAVARKVDLD